MSLGPDSFRCWRQLVPAAVALDDALVAGVGQPVQGAIVQDGVVE